MNKTNFNRILAFIVYSSWAVLLMNVNIFHLIEGMINPVVENVKITSYSNNTLYGNLDKIRNCKLTGMQFYIKNGREYVKIDTKLDEPFSEFGVGNHNFGPMHLDTSKKHLSDSKIRLYHYCDESYLIAKESISIVGIEELSEILANYSYE